MFQAVTAAHLGIYQWDMAGSDVTWANDRIYEIFGRSRSAGPCSMEQLLAECIHPEDSPSFLETARKAREQGTHFHYICRIKPQDTEELRWVELHGEFQVKDGAVSDRLVGVVQDITTRRLAELDRERFQGLGSDLRIISRSLGYFTWVSAAFARLLGRTVEELTSQPWAGFVHPEDKPASAQGSAELHKGRTIMAFENRFRHSDGHYIWLQWNASILPQENTVYAVARNITDRKQAEADRNFLMGLSDMLSSLTDPRAMMQEVGRRIREYFGVARCLFVDYDILNDRALVLYADQENGLPDLVGEYQMSAFATKETLEELHQGRQQVFTNVLGDQRTAVGREHIKALGIGASITSPHVSDGICRHGISVHHKEAHDWSERQVALLKEISNRVWPSIERAQIGMRLRNSLHRLRLVTDSLPVLVSYLDKDQVYRFVNRRYKEWFGITEEEIVGRHLKEVVGEKVYTVALPKIQQVLSGEALVFEQMHHYKVGGSRYVLVNYVPDMDDDGTARGWYALVQDITERRQAEETAREEARRKDEFLATLSHELRNPLSPLKSALDILDMGVNEQEGVMARGVMKRQVDRMTHLIDDLMDLSRISRNKINLRRSRMDLSGAVLEAAEAVAPLVKAEGHALKLDLPEKPVLVNADMNRMVQMINNLLSNAVKFTDSGGQISVTVRGVDDRAVLQVQDNGIGIATEDLDRIFDMFAQVGSQTVKARSGLGIGLHLVKNLTQMHEGSIQVRSDGYGKGSSFILSFPQAGESRA